MVSVLNWQPTGGLMVQADRLGPKVGGHLAPCCTHRVNHGELSPCFKHDGSTINIVVVLLLLLLFLFLTLGTYNPEGDKKKSVQSVAGKLSCKRTALKRCTKIEIYYY